MAKELPLTIIDDKNLRGVIAPSKILSKELLEDVIDFIEWSRPEEIEETERLVAEADRKGSWISGKKIEKELRARKRSLKK